MAQEAAEMLGQELAPHPDIDALQARLDELQVTAGAAKRRLQHIRSATENYDPAAPEASHLRHHQGEAIQGFCEISSNFSTAQFGQGEGIGTLLPTGSGKTVTMTEKLRLLNEPGEFRAVVLVPRLSIQAQTVGEGEDTRGIQAFAPDLSIGVYGGGRRHMGKEVVVMTYQSLLTAIMRGDLAKFNPDAIVCDEMHHVIDGTWAGLINVLRQGRLLVGQTATPAYSEERTVANLFPHIAIRKTMRDGIDEGFLSNLEGYMYKGESRITGSRGSKDFSESQLYRAIADSPDNYLAAKIVASEVEQGGSGIVSCVPGNNRLHARIMSEILSQTQVRTGRGKRPINAAFVDGEVDQETLGEIFKAHERGELDVIAFVDLLLEGWDAPWVDFAVALRPSSSLVLPEQRLGRIMRPGEEKIARIHEFVFEVESEGDPQVTHLDILNEDTVIQGRRFRETPIKMPVAPAKPQQKGKSPGQKLNTKSFSLDPELLARISELDNTPIEEIRVLCGQEPIPYEWDSSYRLAGRFGLSDTVRVEQILEERGIGSRTQEYMPTVVHRYFPERANQVLIEALGVKKMTAARVTMSALVNQRRHQRGYETISRARVRKELEEDGHKPEPRITTDGDIVLTYPANLLRTPKLVVNPNAKRVDPAQQRQEAQKAHKKAQEAAEFRVTPEYVVELSRWLSTVLVDPRQASNGFTQGDLRIIHSIFSRVLENAGQIIPSTDVQAAVKKAAAIKTKDRGLVISGQMQNVMTRNGLTLTKLMAVGRQVRAHYLKLNPPTKPANY